MISFRYGFKTESGGRCTRAFIYLAQHHLLGGAASGQRRWLAGPIRLSPIAPPLSSGGLISRVFHASKSLCRIPTDPLRRAFWCIGPGDEWFAPKSMQFL